LIMVVAFVGFLGASGGSGAGADPSSLAGAAGAVVATFFTFLPSFLFILLGGPLVEATRGDIKLNAPLTAVTAAVVGVIASLALFFAGHVLWPEGRSGPFDARAAFITLGAAMALFRYRLGVMPLLAGCALAGFLLHRW
jgi:chromate transporter